MTKGCLFLMVSCYSCCIRLVVCWLLVWRCCYHVTFTVWLYWLSGCHNNKAGLIIRLVPRQRQNGKVNGMVKVNRNVNGMVTLLLLCMIRGIVFIIRLIVMVTLLYSLLTVTIIMVCTIISYSLHTCIIRVIIKYGVWPATVGIRIGKLFIVVDLFVQHRGFPGPGGFAHL